jgi:hypothetical protein
MNYKLQMNRYNHKEIQDLGLAITLTNSELTSAACKRKYAFDYIEGVSTNNFSRALFFGVSWHYMCEVALNEIAIKDEMISIERLHSIIDGEVSDFVRKELQQYSDIDIEEVFEEVIQNLILGSYSWLEHWANDIYPYYRVIDTEKVLIKPIFERKDGEDGSVMKKEVPFIRENYLNQSILRLPMAGELSNSGSIASRNICIKNDKFSIDGEYSINSNEEKHIVPYYKVGTLDCILQERFTEALWILDHKTSGNVINYARKMEFNFQLASYAALLEYAISQGEFSYLGNSIHIGGVIWDISSSKYNEPKICEDGYLKQVKRGLITYSHAKHILSKPEYLDKQDEYSEYLELLESKRNSNNLFVPKIITYDEIERVKNEDYSNAIEIHNLRMSVYFLNIENKTDMDLKLPRYPICQVYNYCSFAKFCFRNSSFNDPNLLLFNHSPKQHWTIAIKTYKTEKS